MFLAYSNNFFTFQISAPSAENPQDVVNFRLVLLRLCRMEFEKLDEKHEVTLRNR